MARTLLEIEKLVLENRNAVNDVLTNAKTTPDLPIATTPLVGTELIRITQGGVSKYVTADDVKGAAVGDPNVQSDWNQSTVSDDTYIKNKPANLSDFNKDVNFDERYFREDEAINVSAGVADAQKPIKLDATGKVHSSMLPVAGQTIFVERFTATASQSTHTVAQNAIEDNGLWSVQVGSELWNATNGITSFANGLITINFATGQITFNSTLNQGTQVIIKYN